MAFISLSQGLCPEIGSKLSCFIALAPAVFAGPLTHGFPFTTLNKLTWKKWKLLFGKVNCVASWMGADEIIYLMQVNWILYL